MHVTSSDGAATLPANYAFTAGDNGVHQFTITPATVGTQTVTVTDVGTPSITGSGGLTVTANRQPLVSEPPISSALKKASIFIYFGPFCVT